MAEILITGMDMPKHLHECPMRTNCPLVMDGCFLIKDGEKRHKDCPLVEIPPHGDLIERSSAYKVLDDRIAFYKEAGDDENVCNMVCVEGDIVAIPTIIGASKEEEI